MSQYPASLTSNVVPELFSLYMWVCQGSGSLETQNQQENRKTEEPEKKVKKNLKHGHEKNLLKC